MKHVESMWSAGLLIFSILVVATPPADASILDFFFGNGQEDEVEQKPEGAGLFLDDDEFELGKRGFECLQEMAGVDNGDNDWGLMLIRPIARVMLNAYGESGINQLCRSPLLARMRRQNTNRKRRQRRNLASDEDAGNLRPSVRNHLAARNSNHTTTMFGRRRDQQQEATATRSCAMRSAPYPGEQDVDETYDEFARNHLDEYLNSRNERTDPVKTFELQDDLGVVRLAGTVLAQCSLIWSGINQLIAIPDVPVVNQDMISEAVKQFVCDLPNTYNHIVHLRLQRDQELLAWHNKLVESAEVEALYQNTDTLATELCDRETTLARVLSDIEALKDTVDRL